MMRQAVGTSSVGRLLVSGALSTAIAFALASGGTANADDAAGALADRFAAPPPAKRQATPPAKPEDEDRGIVEKRLAPPSERVSEVHDSAPSADTVLDTLRQRLEQAGQPPRKIARPAPTDDRAPARPVSAPPAETRAVPAVSKPLTGNEVFGDGSRNAPPEAAPRNVTTWARPAMRRHGETVEAAPPRPEGPIERVTILLAMKAGNRGIRRFAKTADPIVCIAQSCIISRGPSDAARVMRRRKAFGTINTLGKRAGACKNRRTCIFRDVRLEGGNAEIQPIDLRIMRHDRRERQIARADRTCGIFRGRLTCGRPVESETYTAWIVPEDIAVEAGVSVLEAALRTELAGPRSAALR
jgi:hypothetical protein